MAEVVPRADAPATRLKHKHLLSIGDLSPEEIILVLDTATAMQEIAHRPIKKVPTLRGRTVVNLFFEPSTRTRTSFEVAEKRLSADTLNVAIATSSVVKGETLVDTALNLEAMSPDMIVMRHASSGACHLLSRICKSKIINAGDGMHEHPTQALLDAFTIRSHKGRIGGLKVAIVGDLLHSRVLRSNVLLLTALGAEVWVCGPATLVPPGIERYGVRVMSIGFLMDVDTPVIWRGPMIFKAVEQFLGGPVEQNRAKAIAASPTTYVSKDDAAFLIIHGENDMSIPVDQSQAFADKLKAAGVDVTLEIAKGRGHGVGGPNYASEIIGFFDKHLKPAMSH